MVQLDIELVGIGGAAADAGVVVEQCVAGRVREQGQDLLRNRADAIGGNAVAGEGLPHNSGRRALSGGRVVDEAAKAGEVALPVIQRDQTLNGIRSALAESEAAIDEKEERFIDAANVADWTYDTYTWPTKPL